MPNQLTKTKKSDSNRTQIKNIYFNYNTLEEIMTEAILTVGIFAVPIFAVAIIEQRKRELER